MANFNKQLTRKQLMMFFEFLQLIGSQDVQKLHGRRFVRLKLKPDAFKVQQNGLLYVAVVSYGKGIPVTPLEQFVFLKRQKMNPHVEQCESLQAFYTRLCGYLHTDNPQHSQAVYVEFPDSKAFDNPEYFYMLNVTEVVQDSTDRKNSFPVYIPNPKSFTCVNEMQTVLYSQKSFKDDKGNAQCFQEYDYHSNILKEILFPDSISVNVTVTSNEPSTETNTIEKEDTTIEKSFMTDCKENPDTSEKTTEENKSDAENEEPGKVNDNLNKGTNQTDDVNNT
ncbi:hypothetical protein M153_2110004064 [Pseudoloma neurophilia]|uniref:Uncharacterized protein n=1 Tax=Pseudoloma neurophilia TaxID=146866 RepID=A0A0R0M556_9MICR|nr:hypothetical protein M153_2110004064 [Pseudoloma neurophilia]